MAPLVTVALALEVLGNVGDDGKMKAKRRRKSERSSEAGGVEMAGALKPIFFSFILALG